MKSENIFLLLAWIAVLAAKASAEDAAGGAVTFDLLHRERSPGRALELAHLGDAALRDLEAALSNPATRPLMACALAESPVPALREALEGLVAGPDQVAGYWAAKALGALGDPRSVPVLASQLSAVPRRYWELAFGGPGGYRAVFERIRAGRDETIFATPGVSNLRVACAAMDALGSFSGPVAATVLEKALHSDQHLVRYGAVRGLARRDGPSRGLLERVARTDPALYVRRAALRGIDGASAGRNAAPPSLDRLAHVPAMVFLKTRNRSESNLGFRDSYFFPKTPWYAWGEDLYVLAPPRPAGTLRNLTRLPEGGAVQGPEASAGGTRILAGMRVRAGEPFHVFEICVATGEPRQITRGSANDVDPCYLPGGRIAFSSDRDGTIEYYHQERTRALYVCEADGSEPRQITFNPNQDYEPLALADGSILYSSYRFYGQDGSGGVFSERPGSIARIETQLRTVRPDGFHDTHLYGSGRGGFYVPLRELPDGDQFQAPSLLHSNDHLGVSVSQARELDPEGRDPRLVCITPAGLTVVDPRLDPRDCEAPVFPEVLNLAGGEEVYIHDHDDMNPIGRYTSPYPVGGSLVLVSHAPWHRLGGKAYGIHLLDLETGAKTLVYDDPELSDVDPVPLLARGSRAEADVSGGARLLSSRPPVPSAREEVHPPAEGRPTGRIVILSVFESDLDFDRSRVRYARLLAAEQLAVSMNANGGFRTRVLATVPVERDGSVSLEVPADTPLHFNLLDGDERILVHETEFTYVRPGETRTCVGCHEPSARAPRAHVLPPEALSRPPYAALPCPSLGAPTRDLIYMGQPARTYSVIHR